MSKKRGNLKTKCPLLSNAFRYICDSSRSHNKFKSSISLLCSRGGDCASLPPPRGTIAAPRFKSAVSDLLCYLEAPTMRQQLLAWVVPALVLLQCTCGIWAFLLPCSSSFPGIPEADSCSSSSPCFGGSTHGHGGAWRLRSKCSVRQKGCSRLSASR